MERIPVPALLLSVVAGLAAMPAVVVALAATPLAGHHPHFTAFVASASLGGVFGFLWPAGSWRWGLAVSASLWLYFGFVFVSLWADGQPEALPGVDALVTLLAACGGAHVGSRVSPRSHPTDAECGARSPC